VDLLIAPVAGAGQRDDRLAALSLEIEEATSSGSSKNLKLKPKKSKDAKKIAKALKKGTKAKAKLTVKMTDDLGNKKSQKLSVKLKG
jgi:hypothetical protein